MVTSVPFFVVICAISVHLVHEVAGLMCYECNSLYDRNCDIIRREDKFSLWYKHCDAFPGGDNITEYRRPLCRKITQKIRPRGNLKLTKRSCGYILHENLEDNVCYAVRNEDHEEVVCQCFEDGCNSACSIPINLFLLGVFMVLSLFTQFALTSR